MGDFMGSAVAASGSKGYFAYSMADPEEKCVERGRPVVEGMEAEYGYYCAKDILVGGDDAGVYFRTRSNSGISAEERVTDSTQRHVFKNPKIVFDEGRSNVFILSGGVNIVKGGRTPWGTGWRPIRTIPMVCHGERFKLWPHATTTAVRHGIQRRS